MERQERFFIYLLISSYFFTSIQATTGTPVTDVTGCNNELTLISNQMKTLDDKLGKIQDLLQVKTTTELKSHEFWKGNQSTLGSFKRLTNEAKQSLLTFRLDNTEDLEVSTLLDLLRPCTNLESIELNQVELLGAFPNTSSTRLTLPKLHQFKLLLNNYPNNGFPDVLFFQKEPNAKIGSDIGLIASLKTDIQVSFSGLTKFSIDHNFGELILDFGSTVLDLSVEKLKDFKLKKLTVESMILNTSQIPSDLSYLNLKYVRMNGEFKSTTEYNNLVNNLKSLKNLHIDAKFDGDFKAVINLSELSFYLTAISFRHLQINMTTMALLPNVETLLLDSCLTDDNVIDNFPQILRNIRKIVIESHFGWESEIQCHRLLYILVTSNADLAKLESILYKGCRRYVKPEFQSLVKYYNEAEEFLTNLGLGQASDFHLQRQKGNNNQWVWSGTNATREEFGRATYELSDWHKTRSWKYYARLN